MLSMKLALKMIRDSKNRAYGEVLKMEMNVAMNKSVDAETELGIREILMKPNSANKHANPGFIKEVSHALV